jgi:hypothetical protein
MKNTTPKFPTATVEELRTMTPEERCARFQVEKERLKREEPARNAETPWHLLDEEMTSEQL